MLVRATQKGYYGTVLREPGQIFRLKPIEGLKDIEEKDKSGKIIRAERVKHTFTIEEQFNESWMEEVVEDDIAIAPKGTSKGKRGARPAAVSEDEAAARIAAADEMNESARDADVI